MKAYRTIPAWFLALLVTLAVMEAHARPPLVRETFEGSALAVSGRGGVIVPTPFGKGWASPVGGEAYDRASFHYVAYDISRLNLEQGTLAFRLRRDNKNQSETPFTFVDNTDKGLLYARINWKDSPPHLIIATPGVLQNVWMMRRGNEYPLYSRSLKPVIRLPAIATGQWVEFAFTWGPAAKDHAIYVDGKKLDVELPGPSAIPSLVRRSSHIVFGGAVEVPNAMFNMVTSTLADIRVYDAAVSPSDMMTDSKIKSITDDTFKVPGISGKLVAGDKVNVELLAAPGGKASFDMGFVKGIPMAEVPPTAGGPGIPAVDNGTYRTAYTIKPGDDYVNGQIVGNFVSSDNVAADNVVSASKWTIDTKPQVVFKIEKTDIPADSSSKSRIKLVAKDANGNPLKGRHLKLTLATTDEYTGTVGAGDFGKDVGATVETRWKGETDSWGEVEFDYKAGFAAKTVILTAKDLDSGGVSVDYITSFKEASIDIALTAPVNRAAARRGLQYILKVEASRTWLTADGRSRSVIRATLLDPNGTPVPGDPVAFALSSENGTLRTISGTTDASGTATADYTAGKKIGIVVVTATATLRNASGNVSIALLSDAPAKILLKAKPETMPADGFSRADIQVKVTDINDNPNSDTKVEFRLTKGGGKLDYPDRITDRFGDAANRYTAGTTPGIASILATVRSKVPTDAELAKARNVLFAPYSPEGDQIRVEKWRKKKGDIVPKGEPIVEYTIGRGSTVYVLVAPYDLTLGDIFVEYWDRAEVGQTLAIIIPTVIPGSGSPLPAPAPAGASPRRR